jgi:hypothetical protein
MARLDLDTLGRETGSVQLAAITIARTDVIRKQLFFLLFSFTPSNRIFDGRHAEARFYPKEI